MDFNFDLSRYNIYSPRGRSFPISSLAHKTLTLTQKDRWDRYNIYSPRGRSFPIYSLAHKTLTLTLTHKDRWEQCFENWTEPVGLTDRTVDWQQNRSSSMQKNCFFDRIG